MQRPGINGTIKTTYKKLRQCSFAGKETKLTQLTPLHRHAPFTAGHGNRNDTKVFRA